jgi:superfamily I DNA/RNA helicase
MQAAVTLTEGTPGGGKTTRMIAKIVELEKEGYAPQDMMALTFTKRAQQEAITRVTKETGKGYQEWDHIRTIHSWCMKELGIKMQDMVNDSDRLNFQSQYGHALSLQESQGDDGARSLDSSTHADTALRIGNIMNARNAKDLVLVANKFGYGRWLDVMGEAYCRRVINDWRDYKRSMKRYDFDDLLMLFTEPKYLPKVLFLDEAQDLTPLQWVVVRRIAAACRQVHVYRDLNQTIFTWNGAAPGGFDRVFGQFLSSRIFIDRSYRCAAAIADVAKSILRQIYTGVNPNWSPADAGGRFRHAVQDCPVHMEYAKHDLLVLARTNHGLSSYISDFYRAGYTFFIGDHPNTEYAYVKAGAAYQKMLKRQPVDILDLRRIATNTSVPMKLDGDPERLYDITEVIDVEKHAQVLSSPSMFFDRMASSRSTYLSAAMAQGTDLSAKPNIKLMTVHGSKGAEADVVVMSARGTRRTMLHQRSTRDFDNEARVWYTGASRARKELIVHRPSNKRQDHLFRVYGE